MKILTCAICGTALSKPLMILSGKDPSVAAPVFKDRQPLTPKGTGYKSYEPIEWALEGEPSALQFTPQYWLNPEDMTEQVHRTKNRKRLGGCCGLGGIDGPNQLCACGAEIGTLKTDCWTPLVFVPAPDATLWIEVE